MTSIVASLVTTAGVVVAVVVVGIDVVVGDCY